MSRDEMAALRDVREFVATREAREGAGLHFAISQVQVLDYIDSVLAALRTDPAPALPMTPETPREAGRQALTTEEEANLRAQDDMLTWTTRRGSLWVKRMTEDWQTPYPEEVAVHRLLATLDALRAASATGLPAAEPWTALDPELRIAPLRTRLTWTRKMPSLSAYDVLAQDALDALALAAADRAERGLPLDVDRLARAIHESQQCMTVGRWTERDVARHREIHVEEARRIAASYAARLAADPQSPTDHAHEWVDARNEVVTSGQVCLVCHAIRADPQSQP